MYCFNKHISWQTLDGTLYLTDERDGQLYLLNETGMKMCLALVAGESTESIIQNISEQYAISTQQVTQDFSTLRNDLLQASFIVEVPNEQ